jgi:hypothetical protein
MAHPMMRHQNAITERPPAMKVRVFVSLKNGVLDPQGRAIHHAIEGLAFRAFPMCAPAV